MADITAEDLANLVGAANSLVQTFENKEADIDAKVTALSQSVTTALAGDFKLNRIYVDTIIGDDSNSGSQLLPLKSVDVAISKCSSIFDSNEIYLNNNQTHKISNVHSNLATINIFIRSLSIQSMTEIRSGATDNRAKIVLDIGSISAGDGTDSINDVNNRAGFFPRSGLNLTFSDLIVELAQGFENDTDKDGFNFGPRLISYASYSEGIAVNFFNSRLNFGLGGFIRADGPGLSKIGLAYCDCYLDPAATNLLSKKLIFNTYTAPISYDEISVKYFNSSTGLELSNTEKRNSVFRNLIYSNSASDARPNNLFTALDFSRSSLGLV